MSRIIYLHFIVPSVGYHEEWNVSVWTVSYNDILNNQAPNMLFPSAAFGAKEMLVMMLPIFILSVSTLTGTFLSDSNPSLLIREFVWSITEELGRSRAHPMLM
jgi:hypothetical protein